MSNIDPTKWLFIVFLTVLVAVVLSETAFAIHDNNHDNDHKRTDICVFNVVGSRCFILTNPGIFGDDIAPLPSGDCVNLQFVSDGDVGGPPPADNVRLSVYSDDSATLIKELHNGAPPASPTTFQFCATDTGSPSSNWRLGAFRTRIEVEAGGIGGYTADSDSPTESSDSAPAGCSTGDPCGQYSWGFTSSNFTHASDNGPPTGSFYAYGTASDEIVTYSLSVDKTTGQQRPWAGQSTTQITVNNGYESFTPSFDLTGLASFTHDVDDAYPLGLTSVSVNVTDIAAPGVFNAGSNTIFNDVWNEFVTTATRYTSSGDETGNFTDTYQLDPRIYIDTDGIAPPDTQANIEHSLYNRGEGIDIDFWVFNSRNELLTRSLTTTVGPNDEPAETGSFSITGSHYVGTITAGTGWSATFDFEGEPYNVRVSGQGASATTQDDQFGVTRRYRADFHSQVTNTLNKDDHPTDDVNEQFTYIISADVMHIWCHLQNARGDAEIDTVGSVVLMRGVNPSGSEELNVTDQTGSDGWTSPAQNFAVPAPSGTWTFWCVQTGTSTVNGNQWNDKELIGLSSAFTGNLEIVFYVQPEADVGEEFTVFICTRKNQQVVTPDVTPRIQIRRVNDDYKVINTSGQFQPMLNTMNWTTDVNGSLYAFNFTINEPDVYNIGVTAFIDGSALTMSEPIEIMESNMISIEGIGESQLWHILGWFALFLWSTRTRWAATGIVAFLGLVNAILPDIAPLTFLDHLVFLLIALLLDVAIKFKRDLQ